MGNSSAERLHHPAPGKRQVSPVAAATSVALVGLLMASSAVSEAPSAGAGPNVTDFVEIPYPDMAGLEDAVKEQLNEAHGDLEAWRRQEDPPAAELALAFGRLGQLLHAYELWDAAEACYLNASSREPESFRWRYLLGVVYQRSGRFEKAAGAYRRALDLEPRNLAARVHLGEVYQAQNLSDEAEAELRRALEISPRNPAVEARLGEIALARGDHRAAVELLSGVLNRIPDVNRLHYPLAMAYRGLGETGKAREHLAKKGVVGLAVDDPLLDALENLATGERVHLVRGRTAFAAGRYGEAAEEFRKALEADPRSSRVRVNLGSALGQTGDTAGAVEQYQKALELDPANVTAHFNLGVLRVQLGDDEAAAALFRAAIERKNDDGEAHRQLGLALRRLGRPEEAVESLHSATLLQPLVEDGWLDEVVLLVELKRYADALEQLEDALRILPQSGSLNLALARLLAGCPDASLRDGERALDLARRVYEALPTPGHAATVAMALAETGRCDEAADWQSKALRVAEEQGLVEWTAAQRQVLGRYLAGAPCN